MDVSAVEDAIVGSDGPKTQATKADFVKFHDDKCALPF